MLDHKLSLKNIAGFALLSALFVLLLGCTPDHPMSTFDTQGPVARNQAFIFYIIFWAGAFVFVAVEGAIIYAVIRYRRRRNEGDPEQVHGNTRLEIAWTVAPALVLVVAAVPTLQGIFFAANSPAPAERGGLVVEVTGNQWWFEFTYPEYGVETANELHIPVGEPVNFVMTSEDVIHSFWVPKLAGKTDVIPNNINTMWFQADEEGEFFGHCAEFCGVAHALMRFRVIAQPRPEFEAWLREQAEPAAEPTDPLAQEGFETFMSRDVLCFRCHTIEGTDLARGTVGPNLTHVASRGNLVGLLDNSPEQGLVFDQIPEDRVNEAVLQHNLEAWLTDPDSIKPGNVMARDAEVYNGTFPALTERQIDALVAYLLTLK